MQVSIVAGVREREGRLFDALRMLSVNTEIERPPVADYKAGGALVERKSVRDLHLAIIEGRFWPQIGRLSRTTLRLYLLVEGTDLDAGPRSAASVRGALLAVDELGIGVIRSSGPADSALWLKILASRRQRRRRVSMQRFGSVAGVIDAGPEQWLSIRGVGPKRAQALSETLARGRRHA